MPGAKTSRIVASGRKATFVILSFEGPDRYSRAGGLGTRISDLSQTLARLGFETHLFFIGDPAMPGREKRENGRLVLHRWCQWISRHHPGGVYDGEEGKLNDWERSVPAWLETELLAPRLAAGSPVVLMAEEWQTAGCVIDLHHRLVRRGWQDRVHLLWNANNTYGFDRIDWQGLQQAAAITTVSRYMKDVLALQGVTARVIPNGIHDEWLEPVETKAVENLASLFRGRITLAKVARWDPDKDWSLAVEVVAALSRLGLEPLFLARGGVGGQEQEILQKATEQNLRVTRVRWSGDDVAALAAAIRPALDADMILLDEFLSTPQRRALFRAADAVLANSRVEPFGLVGLETMAVGGVAFVGATGEDYATGGYDAISIPNGHVQDVVRQILDLRASDQLSRQVRLAARESAARYSWSSVIFRHLLPFLAERGAVLVPSYETPKHTPGYSIGDGMNGSTRPAVTLSNVRTRRKEEAYAGTGPADSRR